MRLLPGKIPAVAVVTLCGLIFSPAPAEAQRQSGTSTGGTQATGGIGTGTVTSASGGGSTGGGTAAGTSNTIQGVTGRQAGSQTNQGVAQPQFGTFGEMQTQNGTGFIGRNNNGTFVGQQLPGQQAGQGNLGTQFGGLGTSFGGTQFGGVGANQGTTNRGTGQTTTRSRAAQLRPRHRVAFPFTPVSSATVSSRLQTQVRPLQSQGRVRGVQFSLGNDGTLTLRGTALSTDDRELAAAVARLEPGVRRVNNQIVVPQATATQSAPVFP